MTDTRKDASKITIATNLKMAAGLNWKDEQAFKDAKRGFIATWDPVTITDPDTGKIIWNLVPYLNLQQGVVKPPPTVNPSLWRQAHLNDQNGLFKVCDNIYQVRAFDMSNMTIIEGTTGLIVIDPLISVECAQSALKLYRKHRRQTKNLDVTAVIYTHSHIDHFGGVEGVLPDGGKRDAVQIYAPDGFLEHAVSENVYAGCAMGRRAQYMYGPLLEQDNKGQVDTGLGKGQSKGSVSLFAPTVNITETGQKENIAGVDVIFHLTPGSEAPAEMDFFFPAFKAFCAAENATHNMHNIQTLRGANVRNALQWSKYLAEAVELFGGQAEVLFASHHWPIWGRDNIVGFLERQRDMYRYLNDQTLRMLNKGYIGVEIAEVFEMPEGLAKDWSCRGYYGSTSHNSKAVYDRYLGWFDGNPSNLHRLPPEQSAPKYVDLMGGPAAVIAAAKKAAKLGEYRWAAELLGYVVFANQKDKVAKNLQADVLEQMGYQAENATWRNFYLQGAKELREGVAPPAQDQQSSPTMIAAMTVDMLFDALASKIIGPQVGDTKIVMNWIFTDPVDPYVVKVQDGVLTYTQNRIDPRADVSIMLSRDTLNRLMAGQLSPKTAIDDGLLTVSGDLKAFLRFFMLLDDNDPSFPIVTPRADAKTAWDGPERLANLQEAIANWMNHPRIAKARDFLGEIPRGC
jgi:alkyl sulfatase BDS1-like metallo-beta-lactamase superfamily hydrolase